MGYEGVWVRNSNGYEGVWVRRGMGTKGCGDEKERSGMGTKDYGYETVLGTKGEGTKPYGYETQPLGVRSGMLSVNIWAVQGSINS